MNRFEKLVKEEPIKFWVELIRCHYTARGYIGCEYCIYNSYKIEGFDPSEDYLQCSVCYDEIFEAELCKAVYETVLKKKIEEAEKRG